MYMGPNDKSKIMYTSNFKSAQNSTFEPNKYRTILHCDANSFFASCETALHPEYKDVPMAVCGSVEDRHGIVLAKNELAAKYNIKTAETVWSAKRKCPELLTVRPTYGLYGEMSQKMNRIFYDYTDLIEPFGIDESWLDVTGSLKLFGNGREIADSIRERVKNELGITVSIGVSFNKVFAKLGSDLQKPNATSVIPPDRFASIVWPLPVSCLLFVGPSSVKAFETIGVRTIGDLACCDDDLLSQKIGKNGMMLKNFALGRDFSEVTQAGFEPEPKSVSNGMTFRHDLETDEDISFAVTYLSLSVAERLRKHGLCCNNVAVTMRRQDLSTSNRSATLSHPTCLFHEISKTALGIIRSNLNRNEALYSLTVHAEKLTRQDENIFQQCFFPLPWEEKYKKIHSLENTVDNIKKRFGNTSINIASAINNNLI